MGTLNRRQFLKGCGCSALAWGTFPWLDLKAASAAVGNGTKLLIVNLNGGWDGLSVLQPNSGALFSTLNAYRPTLIQSPSGLYSLGNGFGFAQQLSTFKNLYDEGSLLGICNVGYRNMSRSHDESESVFAQGASDRLHPVSSGFINRLGAQYRWHSLQAVSVSGTERAFTGEQYRAVQVNGLQQYRFKTDRGVSAAENDYRRNELYLVSQAWPTDPHKPTQADVVGGVDLINNTTDSLSDAVTAASYTYPYPNTDLGKKFQDVDVLFSTSSLGTEVGYVRRGGFDSHSNQAAVLPSLLTEFNDALAAFVSNMKAKALWSNLIVLVISEFGRTNRENGSLGTDHGGAVPVFVMGGGVRGGQIIGEVLPTDLTDNGWLPMRFNIVDVYRSVFERMGYDPNTVFQSSGDATVPALFR